jgi:hypothetical protein
MTRLQQLPLDVDVAPFGRHAQRPEASQEPEQQSEGLLQRASFGAQHVWPWHVTALGFFPQSSANVHAPPIAETSQRPPVQTPVQQSPSEAHDVLFQSPGMQHVSFSQYGVDGQQSLAPHCSP